ncbi:MAG: hypothetical protein WBW04_21425 [Nitrolancea sp.]
MLYKFVSGDFPLTIMFFVFLGLFAQRHWSGVRSYWTEKNLFWRIVGRTALILTVVLPLWIATFDNWRQLLGYSLSAKTRFKSDVFDTAIPSDAVRIITLVLIGISLVCVALIYARRQHGLGMLSIIFIFAAAFFYFFNGLRMRADVFLATTKDSLGQPTVVDTSFILFWSLGMYMVVCAVIAAAYAWLFSVLAIPLHIVFSIAMRNKNDVDPDSLVIYRKLRSISNETTRNGPPESHDGTPPIEGKSVAH